MDCKLPSFSPNKMQKDISDNIHTVHFVFLSQKRLAKEARAQEIQAKNAALGKKGREPAASKGMKGRGEASFYRVTCKV